MTDAIVIGAGHNGLVTAFYLAKAGLKPLVLERRDVGAGDRVADKRHRLVVADVLVGEARVHGAGAARGDLHIAGALQRPEPLEPVAPRAQLGNQLIRRLVGAVGHLKCVDRILGQLARRWPLGELPPELEGVLLDAVDTSPPRFVSSAESR